MKPQCWREDFEVPTMLERWSEVPVEKSPNIEDKVLKYLQCWKDVLKYLLKALF
jgi:hypothetical protein